MDNEQIINSMEPYFKKRFQPFEIELKKLDIKINSLFDIGSKMAIESSIIQKIFGIKDNNIFCSELADEYRLFTQIKFPNYKYSNFIFYSRDNIPVVHQGRSLLMRTAETFINKNFPSGFDFLKIDGSGDVLDILKGFGPYLNKAKIIYMESMLPGSKWEHHENRYNSYYDDNIKYMSQFTEIFNSPLPDKQIGSILINKDFL